MNHLWVPAFLVVLLVGIWAFVSLNHVASSKKHLIIRYWKTIIVGCNVIVLIDLVVTYLCLNIIDNCEEVSGTPIHFISFAIGMLGLVGIVWALIAADRLLTAGGISAAWRRGSGAGAALIATIVVLGGVAGLLGADYRLLTTVDMALYFALLASLAGVLGHMTWFGLRRSPREERRKVAEFGLLFLGLFCLSLAFLALPKWMGIFQGMLVLLFFDVYPVYWVKRYLPAEDNGRVVTLDDPALLEAVFQDFAVSKREAEIAKLILKGMSNKEIEDALFISMNTVKNHIYRLYRKLGVNSRGQFVNLLLGEQKKRNGQLMG